MRMLIERHCGGLSAQPGHASVAHHGHEPGASIAALENPAQVEVDGFDITTALYIADGLAARKCPPDPFPPEEWNKTYLEAAGCLEDFAVWEKL